MRTLPPYFEHIGRWVGENSRGVVDLGQIGRWVLVPGEDLRGRRPNIDGRAVWIGRENAAIDGGIGGGAAVDEVIVRRDVVGGGREGELQ